ncbi:hypothetical protein NPX13_g6654 [Xylaria arbuscula]|uniref:Eukaryotic translation initiation factor 5B n=1 Tax=Xylaria arbuscula TaxID=114810 RepID=A0A9W8NBT5_9PEZI|nr:hypothetical protein NPX13_g6654 [Xylaria arbuscula]
MAFRKKAMERRKKKGLSENFVDGDSAQPATPEPTDITAFQRPQEATAEDEFALPEKKGKGGKQNKNQPAAKAAAAAADGDDGDSGKILTKAEKEKLKKEREKQRKKEQKTTTPAPAAKAAEPAKPAAEEKQAPAPAPAAEAPAKKGKKLPPHLAAIQKQQEELRRQREEAEQAAESEKARLAELEKQEAEDAKRKEEERARKKQKEKERIEQLKKEGKYLTKAQKEEKARNERKLQQMRDAGLQVGPSDDGEKKKKVTYDNKKRGKQSQQKVDEEKLLAEAAERARLQAEAAAKEAEAKAAAEAAAQAAAEEAAKKAAAEEEVEDDWEAAAASGDDVKDSWDADSDEEADKKTAAKEALPSRPKGKAASESDSESEEESSEDEEQTAARAAVAQRKKEAAERREKAHQAALAARSKENLRSPICCILGHVDTGKTKLLDKIRQTNVQEGEAGGITQQIGATYFPGDAIKAKTAVVNADGKFELKVPGLLIIDTPGHESFSNLRSRGSSLCNIAILVVDIMHGLEPQTLESMKLLRDRKTPFIVALNKIDRLYGWKKVDNNGFQESLALQSRGVQNEFKNRLEQTKLAFSEQGFNAEVFHENKSMAKYVSLVPTSAHTGEGIPDMLKLIVQLTQERMVGSLMYLSEVQATVLEVKAIEGFGMTIDVILSNGILREGDRIVVCGVEGAITTNIRALLTPAVMKELRVKSQYVHNKEVKAAMGVKISAPGLEGAIAGSRLLVVGPDDDEEELEEEVEADLNKLFSRVSTSGRGVSVQASTLGSLEALLDFLKDCKIPVANVGIGPVFKRDVMQCGTMLEKSPDYAVMLCFDVKVDKEAAAYAEENGIKIFTADIIYHLFDAFTKHMDEQLEKKKEESKLLAVFPCVLNTVAVFNKTNPIVVGVDVIDGNLRVGTPIAAVRQSPTGGKEIISMGRVSSIERDHKQIPICKKGQPSVAVKIEMGGNQPTYGRQLEESDTLYSLISRASINCLKEFYRKEVTNDEWALIIKLKPLLGID